MEIGRTGEQTQYPWPEDVFVQGGARGLVISRNGNYGTAFVEAFPAGTFLRGEGATVAEAETACWEQYQRLVACPAHPEHGPFERRNYRNGAGFCIRCGAWFSHLFPELPDDPDREPGPLESLILRLGEPGSDKEGSGDGE
jgi:hypothetical protein